MRHTTVDRRRLAEGGDLPLPEGLSLHTSHALGLLDDAGLPDGYPIYLDDDGSIGGCRHLNLYLLRRFDAQADTAHALRQHHGKILYLFLRFLRRHRAEQLARDMGMPYSQWCEAHDEPRLDLTDATRADLTAYRARLKEEVKDSTSDTRISCLGVFYKYATNAGWIDANPMPQWSGRNTLLSGTRYEGQERHIDWPVAAHFLHVGLRGDDAEVGDRPTYPERDWTHGLTLATTGLRRQECAYLLDCELPRASDLPPDGVHVIRRKGKGGVERTVYFTEELAAAADLYRRVERDRVVSAAQDRLRALRRDGRLVVFNALDEHRGTPLLVQGSRRVPVARLPDEQRASAVLEQDDGTLEPLGLFLGRGGLPMSLDYWGQLYSAAHDRVVRAGGPLRPPAHIKVTQHTMRHTFAVRMLSALAQEGLERCGDPYLLLANPALTVMQLLGHASLATTQRYVQAAVRQHDTVVRSVRVAAVGLIGHTAAEPGADVRLLLNGKEDPSD